MDNIICQICSKKFELDKGLHIHLRKHDITIEKYYHKFFPRHDMFTKELIIFKNRESYFETDFNSKINMKKWFESSPIEIVKEYAKKILLNRKEKKGLIYAPTQVELRSLNMPSIITYEKLFGNYYELCESLGFKNKHKQLISLRSESYITIMEPTKIIIDSREQKPLKFNDCDTIVEKLEYGDYALNHSALSSKTHIERKSLQDFIGTLSAGYDRFCKEIERAAEDGAKLVILVENKFEQAIGFEFLPWVKKYNSVNSAFIFHKVRELCQKYPHIQFLFVNGRVEASRMVHSILLNGRVLHEVDLQLNYDLGKI